MDHPQNIYVHEATVNLISKYSSFNDINRAERRRHHEETRYKFLLIDARTVMLNMMLLTSLQYRCWRD